MKFSINEKEYTLKSSWYDLTIQDAINVVSHELDEERHNFLLENDELEYDDHTTEYQKNVIVELSNCPKEILDKLDKTYISVLFINVKTIVLYLYKYNFEKHEMVGVEEINFKGTIYRIPESLRVNGEDILMFKEPSKNVLEVSNLMKLIEEMSEKGVKLLPYVVAIYLRELDTQDLYDDEIVNKRAEVFHQLPLWIAYEVFFFTYVSMCNSAIALKIFLEREKRKKFKKIRNLVTGFIKWLKVVWSRTLELLKKCLFGKYVKS